jgi:hypothetical protein
MSPYGSEYPFASALLKSYTKISQTHKKDRGKGGRKEGRKGRGRRGRKKKKRGRKKRAQNTSI